MHFFYIKINKKTFLALIKDSIYPISGMKKLKGRLYLEIRQRLCVGLSISSKKASSKNSFSFSLNISFTF